MPSKKQRLWRRAAVSLAIAAIATAALFCLVSYIDRTTEVSEHDLKVAVLAFFPIIFWMGTVEWLWQSWWEVKRGER